MVYKGIVKGNVVELEEGVRLPEGTTVEVVVKGPDIEPIVPSGYPNGSPQAILAALDTPPHCTAEDVDELRERFNETEPPCTAVPDARLKLDC